MMRVLLNLFLALMIVAVTCPAMAPVHAEANTADSQEGFLQFTAGGHMLGCGQDGVWVAGMDHALRVQFAGGKPVQPVAESSGTAPNGAVKLGSITWNGIWDGVDIVYSAAEGCIAESTYHLNFISGRLPVDSIRLLYNRPVSLDGQGNLVVAFENGQMIESAPRAWQVIDGMKRPVDAAFVLLDEREAGFALNGYLPDIPVVIDPTLTWNTFLGGDGNDWGYAIAVDRFGDVYVAGASGWSWGSPVREYSGNDDAFVAKLSGATGALIWNTFLGGPNDEAAYAIAVDGSGNVYVAGWSQSTWGSPVQEHSTKWSDAFAAKLSCTTGALTWNTFLGGDGWDEGYAIAVDGSNVCVTGRAGWTWGSPVREFTPGDIDTFVAKLSCATGILTWITFLGGDGSDLGAAIAIDGAGNVYVAGQSTITWGSPIQEHSGNTDAFVAKLIGTTGHLAWHTFLGGTGNEWSSAIALGSTSNVYVTGTGNATWGNPVQAYSGNYDAFVAKLKDGTGTLIWNTFLGGTGDDWGYGIAVDRSGNVHVAGYSTVTWGNPVRAYTGKSDAFVAQLGSGTGAFTSNTFLGGTEDDAARAIAADESGNICVAGYSNATWGRPVQAYTGVMDAFAAKLQVEVPVPAVLNVQPNSGQKGQSLSSVVITGANLNGASVVSFGDGITVNSFSVNSATQITAFITISAGAAQGIRNVSVTTPTGTATGYGLFTVTPSVIGAGTHGSGGSVATAPPSLTPTVNLANILPQSASLSTTHVHPGEALTVTAVMSNTGNVSGTTAVKLSINGQEESVQGITVNGASTMPVNFTVSRDEPGTYAVYVNGTSAGSFTVDQFTPDTILFISGTLVFFSLLGSLIFLLGRKRRI